MYQYHHMVFAVIRPRLLLETRRVFETCLVLEQMQSYTRFVFETQLLLEEIWYSIDNVQ